MLTLRNLLLCKCLPTIFAGSMTARVPQQGKVLISTGGACRACHPSRCFHHCIFSVCSEALKLLAVLHGEVPNRGRKRFYVPPNLFCHGARASIEVAQSSSSKVPAALQKLLLSGCAPTSFTSAMTTSVFKEDKTMLSTKLTNWPWAGQLRGLGKNLSCMNEAGKLNRSA